MALILHSPPSCLHKKPPHLLLHTPLFPSPTKPSLVSTKPSLVSIKSQDSSSTQSPEPTTITGQPASDTSSKKPNPSGLGFGSSSSSSGKSNANPVSTKKNQGGKRERASVIRRAPAEKPGGFISPEREAQAKEQGKNESAFLLAWLGLGAVILVEGILLAASGFLPEEWDKFFVKYLYPSFTPTVFLFVAGTTAYGVLKYLQNENSKTQK